MFRRKVSKDKPSQPTALKPLHLIVLALIVLACLVGIGLFFQWQLWQLFVFPAIGLAVLLGAFLTLRFGRKVSKDRPSHPTALKPLRLIVLALIVLVCLVGVGLFFQWQLWQLFVFPAIGLAVLFGGFLTLRWWSLRRRAALLEKEAAQETARQLHPDQHTVDNIESLRHKWSDALRTVRGQGFRGVGEDPIYKSPWFLVLGEPGSGKSSFIKAAHPQLPIVHEVSPTQNCDWYFFNQSILLDTAGRYAHGAKPSDEAEWAELLSMLHQHRRWEPINGVVITVAADTLVSRELANMRLEAGHLRKRLDEMVHRLGTKFPVYLVVTKLDKIAGFSEFFRSLPDQALDQAMGAVDPDFPGTNQLPFFDRTFASISQRLESLTLPLMSKSESLPVGNFLFTFPQEFKKLQEPLRIYVNSLFLQNPYQEIPGFRALLFTSARQEGAAFSLFSKSLGFQQTQNISAKGAREYFIGSIVSTVLPKDRSLAQRTTFWREEHKVGQAGWLTAAVTACLVLTGFFILSFRLNSASLSNLKIENCAMSGAKTVLQALGEADRCRQAIDGLKPDSWWKRLLYGFGLHRTEKLEDRLKQRFVEGLHTQVISKLDTRITAQLAGAEAPSFAKILARRIKLMAACEDTKSCRFEGGLGPQDYLLMLKAEDPGIKVEGAENKKDEGPVGQLKRSHEAFLVWGADQQVLSNYRPMLVQNLKGWLDKNYRWTELVLQSVKPRFQADRVKNFWGDNRDNTVGSPYTGEAWSGAIEPLLSAMREVPSDLGEAQDELKIFELDYRNEALRQWEKALNLFSEGRTTVPRTPKEWALKVMDSNPPEAVLKKSFDNLDKLLGGGANKDGLPAWVKTLRRYQEVSKLADTLKTTGTEEKAATTGTISKLGKMLERTGQEEKVENLDEAAKHLAAYRSALRELRDQLVTPKESFQSAHAAFAEGAPSEKSKHPLLKAQWHLEQLRKMIRAESDEDEVFWRLLNLPLVLYWRAMLNETGKHLQEEWKKVWVALPDKYQQPGGKAREVLTFVSDQAGNFLTTRGSQYVANELLNEKVAFRGEFLGHIAQLPRYSPETLVDLRFPEEIIQTQ